MQQREFSSSGDCVHHTSVADAYSLTKNIFLETNKGSNVWQSCASKVIVKVFSAVLALATILLGQSGDSTRLERQVQGQVLTSKSDPAVQITFAPQFKYAGGQRFLLYGVAEAEQHFYTQSNTDGKIERFYWVQFEHYLPDNKHQYDYPSNRTTNLGGLTFIYDTAVFSDYAGANGNPDSDGAKARAMLKKSGLVFPSAMARIRMVHLPGSARRSELMIIYGEALNEKAPPNSAEGLEADDPLPELSAQVRQHAAEGMKIQPQ